MARKTPNPLSPRELEVVECIASDLSTEQLATFLGMAEGTARTHRQNALKKLGVKHSAAAVALAIRGGWFR